MTASVLRLKFLQKKAWGMRVHRLNNVYILQIILLYFSHKKYQILIISNSYYGLSEWQAVLIRVQSIGLLWKPCVLVKAFWVVKHVTFPVFSGVLVFGNLLKGPIQYSLFQSQQRRHQNNVPDMFTVNIR